MIFNVILLTVFTSIDAYCDIPHVTESKSGSIGFEKEDQELTREQNCFWTLSRFPNHVLYMRIFKYDFRNGSECVATVILNGKEKPCNMRQQCYIFTMNNNIIDLDAITKQSHDFEDHPCTYWKVKQEEFQNISIETVGNGNNDFNFRVFYIFISATPKTVREHSNVTDIPKDETWLTNAGDSSKEFAVAFGVTFVLLCLAVIIIIGCFVINRRISGTRQPRTRGSFYQTDSVDGEADLSPVASPVLERKLDKSELTRFSRLKKKNTRGKDNSNFIHFTLTRDGNETPQRSNSLPDVARFAVGNPSGGEAPARSRGAEVE